jgi:hypothetical protein
MQKWEYMTLVQYYFGDPTRTFLNGKELSNRLELHTLLSQLGGDGWELVTSNIFTNASGGTSSTTYVLKRPSSS